MRKRQPHLRGGAGYAGLRIGLLGGSFNPAHGGHLAISRHALKALGLDQIWWLVSPQNPLKPAAGMAPLAERLNEARQVARHPRICVTALEAEFGTRYTVDTLRALRRRFPHTRFVWLMGADNWLQLPRWRDWAALPGLAPVAVFRRPAYAAGRGRGQASRYFDRHWRPPSQAKRLQAPGWTIMDNRLSGLSATDIRKERAQW